MYLIIILTWVCKEPSWSARLSSLSESKCAWSFSSSSCSCKEKRYSKRTVFAQKEFTIQLVKSKGLKKLLLELLADELENFYQILSSDFIWAYSKKYSCESSLLRSINGPVYSILHHSSQSSHCHWQPNFFKLSKFHCIVAIYNALQLSLLNFLARKYKEIDRNLKSIQFFKKSKKCYMRLNDKVETETKLKLVMLVCIPITKILPCIILNLWSFIK